MSICVCITHIRRLPPVKERDVDEPAANVIVDKMNNNNNNKNRRIEIHDTSCVTKK